MVVPQGAKSKKPKTKQIKIPENKQASMQTNKQKATTVHGPSLVNNLKEGTHLGTEPFVFFETSLHLNLVVGKAASSLIRFVISETEKEDMKNGIPQSQSYLHIHLFRETDISSLHYFFLVYA